MADAGSIAGLRKEFGGVIALAGVDISIESDKIVGIIGPNGSGKTTLFNVIAGVHKPTAGCVTVARVRISLADPRYRIARDGIGADISASNVVSGPLGPGECPHRVRAWARARWDGSKQRWSSPEEILSFVGLSSVSRDEWPVQCHSGICAASAVAVRIGRESVTSASR